MAQKIFASWKYRLSSIKAQLILGFGLILALALIIAVIGFVSLRNLQIGVETTFEEANHVRELSLEIENDFLLARQSEANFLNTWSRLGYQAASTRYVIPNQDALAQAHLKLDEVNQLIAKSESANLQALLKDTNALKPLLDEYQRAFLATVSQVEERSQANGLDRKLQKQLTDLETLVVPLPRVKLDRVILQIRANEQSYFHTRNQQSLDKVHLWVIEFIKIVKKSSDVDLTGGGHRLVGDDLIEQINGYDDTLSRLVVLEQNIDINTRIFREVTEKINELTHRLDEAGSKALTVARLRLENISRQSTRALIFTAMLALGLASLTGWFLTQRISQPLRQLTRVAQELGQGNLGKRAQVSGPREFATMSIVFNDMATQLQNLVGSLEERVKSRTRRLELVAALGEKLNAILDQQELLNVVVNQINSNFGYYYATVCLFDETRQHLFFATGTGEAGFKLKASGFNIPLNHPKSLIARAARDGEVVWENDLTTTQTWLQIDVLPDTRAEMCVPIFEEEHVVGVLDVQEDHAGGLDEGDASLLRSLANQLGVAMHNARLYNIVQQELEERHRAEAALQSANLQLQERALELEQKRLELEQQTLELAQAKESAEAASLAKSEFLASMSHELRTPLHGVLGFTQILSKEGDLTPVQQSHLHVIQRSGEHLLTLLNDVLDLSRIEVHKMELQPSQFYFKLFLDKVFDMCRFRAMDKGLAANFETTSALPTTIFADEKRLRQTLINLLGNAVKFTEQGHITFRVGILADTLKTKYVADNYSATVRFEVEDSGIGISPEQLQKIFLPFEQVGGGRDQADGAGLGLTISQRFVGIMGGELHVKSQVGQGSTFWFDLPLAVSFSNQSVEPTPSQETVSILSTISPTDPVAEKIIPPSPEILTLLLSLIEIGDFDNLEAQVTQLCQTEAQFKPFGQQLLELAGQFEEEKMIALLEEYRGASA